MKSRENGIEMEKSEFANWERRNVSKVDSKLDR